MTDIISSRLRKNNISRVGIDALVTKIIWDVYFENTQRDISHYIQSVHISEGKLFIKTTKPLISEEILIYEQKIAEKVLKKLHELGEIYQKIDIYCK